VKAKKLDKQVKSKMRRLEKEFEQNKWEKPKQETKASFQFQASGKRGHRIIGRKVIWEPPIISAQSFLYQIWRANRDFW
jgi:ribosomal protein S20